MRLCAFASSFLRPDFPSHVLGLSGTWLQISYLSLPLFRTHSMGSPPALHLAAPTSSLVAFGNPVHTHSAPTTGPSTTLHLERSPLPPGTPPARHGPQQHDHSEPTRQARTLRLRRLVIKVTYGRQRRLGSLLSSLDRFRALGQPPLFFRGTSWRECNGLFWQSFHPDGHGMFPT